MRNLPLLGILLLLASGCTSDDDLGFAVTNGDRLVRYMEFYDSKETKNLEFIYDEQNQLTETKFHNFGPTTGRNHYFYDDKQKLEKILRIYDSPLDHLQIRYEYFYDEINRLSEAKYFSSYDAGATFQKQNRSRTKFHYNQQGEMNRKQSFFQDSVPQTSWNFEIENYHFEWENGNIAKVEEYNRLGLLVFTSHFKYDNKKNYKTQQPEIFIYPETHTQNNVVTKTITDHLGYLPYLSCTVCKITYKYNQSGRPVMYSNQEMPKTYSVLTYE